MTTQSILIQTRLNLSKNEFLDFQYLRALAYQQYGGAAVGEIIKVAHEIKAHGNTRRDFVEAWIAQGRHVAQLASEALAKNQCLTARAYLLRAYNYLRVGEFYFDHQQQQAHKALYMESINCFEQAIHLFDTPVEKISIPYEHDVLLPGYFFKASSDNRPRTTVIICGGGDGAGEEMYFLAGVPEALNRGMNVLVFHGPGQRGILHQYPHLVFRPESELPIGAVIDYVLSRPDVNPLHLALYGFSFGGYLSPRAAAHDKRIKALIANAPMTNFYDVITSAIVEVVPSLLSSLAKPLVDVIPDRLWNGLSNWMSRSDWAWGATIENSMLWTLGATTFAEFLEIGKQFRLEGLEKNIICPTLCLAAEGEAPEAMKQARQFYEALQVPKKFYELKVMDGADGHCGINNIAHTSALAYDWLTDTFTNLNT